MQYVYEIMLERRVDGTVNGSVKKILQDTLFRFRFRLRSSDRGLEPGGESDVSEESRYRVE